GAGNTSAWSTSQFTVGADASRSTLAAGTTSLSVGASTTVTLTARDTKGNQETSGGLVVRFGLGSGSGQGTFGPVQDKGDGTYTAPSPATPVGSTPLTATIGGQAVTSPLPGIIVTQPRPVVTTQPANQVVVAGSTATFTATASGTPTVQWQVSTNGGA